MAGDAPSDNAMTGVWAICRTELMTVMTLMYKSPPKVRSVALQAACTRLSVKDITKLDAPSAMMRPMQAASGRNPRSCRRNSASGPVKKRSTHNAESPCERMVASAAPRTPMPRA